MPTPQDRRSRKRLATRDAISGAATQLFFERGFDNVTVDEIAAAADVGRMTVFNHYPRKEDMFFDRNAEVDEILRDAARNRGPGVAPIEAYRLLAHRVVAERSPYVAFSACSRRFMETIEASGALMGRARAMRDEFAQVVAAALAESVDRDAGDPDAQLAGGLLAAAWAIAVIQAHQTFRKARNSKKAQRALLETFDKGILALMAALAGTPYAGQGSLASGATEVSVPQSTKWRKSAGPGSISRWST